jgi:hypothetical protein
VLSQKVVDKKRELAAAATFWSASAGRRFLSFSLAQSRKKESGVQPTHSKKSRPLG